MVKVMRHYKLNKRFVLYGILISYVFGRHYTYMGIDEKYAVVISASAMAFFVIGVFGMFEFYPRGNRRNNWISRIVAGW